jgi:hypothetical protein
MMERESDPTKTLHPNIISFPPLIAFAVPISLVWLGWANYPSIRPLFGVGAAARFGLSWAGIYVPICQYILEFYGIYTR